MRWVNTLDPSLIHDAFTEAEDNALRKAVEEKGVGKWSEIARHFPGRTDRMLLSRWSQLCPGMET
jgi:hypothetical protein